ncbi:MAG: hypothetical protein DMG93_21450 [Acidobacteria bacterium]|nr:MAG: hypothetical protein DMG93_21450 [Acidobacteriota bacterium]
MSVVGKIELDFAFESRRPRAEDAFLFMYPIDPFARLHRFDNERAKFAIKRVKLAVGGAK